MPLYTELRQIPVADLQKQHDAQTGEDKQHRYGNPPYGGCGECQQDPNGYKCGNKGG